MKVGEGVGSKGTAINNAKKAEMGVVGTGRDRSMG
jgi:hypothetical protein